MNIMPIKAVATHGLLLLALIFLVGVSADLGYRANAINSEYPGQCYYEELKQPIPKYQSYKPINREGHCKSFYCRPDYVLEIEYCGRHNLMPTKNCKIGSDMRRIFPHCCPKLICQEPESNDI